MRVAAVVLAAGGSSRMGRPKQLLEVKGEPLLQRAVRAALASRCQTVRVVLGAHADEAARVLAGIPAEPVLNPRWREGLSTSIAVGVQAALREDDPDAVLLLLADQPHVRASLLDALIETFPGGAEGISACAYGGGRGVPALFGKGHFAALCALEGDRGARPLLDAHGPEVVEVRFDEGVIDIDTPEDYARLGT